MQFTDLVLHLLKETFAFERNKDSNNNALDLISASSFLLILHNVCSLQFFKLHGTFKTHKKHLIHSK